MSLTYSVNQPSQAGSRSMAIAMIIGIHIAALMAFNNGIGKFFVAAPPPPPPLKVYEFKDEPLRSSAIPLPQLPTATIDQHIDVPVTPPTINLRIDSEIGDLPPIGPTTIQTDAIVQPPVATTRLSVVKRVDPAYPAHAEAAGNEGTVLLEVVVDTSGHATDVHIASSSGFDVLDQAAMRAVRQWKFNQPATIVKVRVPITFKLTQRF